MKASPRSNLPIDDHPLLSLPFTKPVVLGQDYPKPGEFDSDRRTFAVKWSDGLPESMVHALQNFFPKSSDVNGNR